MGANVHKYFNNSKYGNNNPLYWEQDIEIINLLSKYGIKNRYENGGNNKRDYKNI